MDIPYRYRPVLQQAEGDALFFRMREEGLTPCAMYACRRPSLRRWRHITRPGRGLLPPEGESEVNPGAFARFRFDAELFAQFVQRHFHHDQAEAAVALF